MLSGPNRQAVQRIESKADFVDATMGVFAFTTRTYLIGATALICVVAAVASEAGDEGVMPDLNGAVLWLNSLPLSSEAL